MDFLARAHDFADALLRHGTDRYGRVRTPMFCHMIDLETLAIPAQHTAAEWRALMTDWEEDRQYLLWGKDRSNLAWAHQSNLLWDVDAVRLLIRLTERTGDARYAGAADAYMRHFLATCVHPATGLFAWGEHVAYNVETDRIEGERHELQHADPLWEELWRIDPDAVAREIEGLYRYHVVDHDAMIYDRHARFRDGLPERDRATILGYAGIFGCAWAFLGRKTGDAKYLDRARRQILAFQSKQDANGLYPDNWTDADMRELPRGYAPRLHLGRMMLDIFRLTDDSSWLDDGVRYIGACVRANDAGVPDGSFGLDMSERTQTFVAAFVLTGDREWRDRAVAVADRAASEPMPRTQMASHMAGRIAAYLDLWDATADPRWLDEAGRAGEFAVDAFVHPSGLIRGTAIVRRRDYYDAIQGSGQLARTFLRLGEAIEARDAGRRPEPARIVDVPPVAPVIADIAYPAAQPNDAPVEVRATIAHPGARARAILHYAVGNRVGMCDDNPVRSGDVHVFTIPPQPGFEGEVRFAVEAVGTDGARGISPWLAIEYRSETCARPGGDGVVALPALGVRTDGLAPGGTATVVVRAGRPDRDVALPHPYEAIRRSWEIDGEGVAAGRLSLDCTDEQIDRLVAGTLRLARRVGDRWEIAEEIGEDASDSMRRVTGPYLGPGTWTVAGRRRILWQAAQRESNPTLADIDGDGRREVLATQYANGEVLDSSGATRLVLDLRHASRPVQNTSSPVAADIDRDGRVELVYGATSGHVHCFEADGRPRWKAEVGGEVRGGIVLARLPGETRPVIGVAWHDAGAAVVNADGTVRWQRDLPKPADVTPVLYESMPDGPVLLIAAYDGLHALRCADGVDLWRVATELRPVAPAVGALVRGGEERIFLGDAGGRVTVVDSAGRVEATWDVPYTHEAYRAIVEVGLADLRNAGRRQVVVTTAGGLVRAYEPDGTLVWEFVSREQERGIALGVGGRLAFADLVGDGSLHTVVAEQDGYVYALDPDGRKAWEFRGAFFYHYSPVVADLDGSGELVVVTTSPCGNGTYALLAGRRATPGAAPWPTMRGDYGRTNCAPWT